MTVTSGEAIAQNKALLAEAQANLNAVLKAAQMGTEKALTEVGIAVVAAVKVELSKPGSGRVYYIRRSKNGKRYLSDKGPGAVHQASAPGEPPAPDTGQYRASWAWVSGKNALGPYVDVGTNAVIGPYLEFGTANMAARPHIRPVMLKEARSIQAKLVEAIVAEEEKAIASLRTSVRKLL